jgi:hypothetical protein
MKIDKVILSTNNNKTYTGFWNQLSKLYKLKFGIHPVLIFMGTKEELDNSELSSEYGQIIQQDLVDSKLTSWTTTWSLFYFTKLFPDDICLTMGIDQIPMGDKFLKTYISEFDDDKYIMIIDDAYKIIGGTKSWSDDGIAPSAYHIAKGSTFDEIYKFESSFEDEIKKIENKYEVTWGLDEIYSSRILKNFNNKNRIITLSKFNELSSGGRLECYRTEETSYDLDKLSNNGYIECHSCRPYENHKVYLDKLFDDIHNNLKL